VQPLDPDTGAAQTNPAASDAGASAPKQSRRRWAWLPIGVLLALTKLVALGHLVAHPRGLAVVLCLGCIRPIRRARIPRTLIPLAAAVALFVDPSSVGVGIEIGLGSLIALVVLSVAIGTVLMLVDKRHGYS